MIDRTKNVIDSATKTTGGIAKDTNEAMISITKPVTSFSTKIMQQLPKMGKISAAFAGIVISTFFPGLSPITQAFTGI